MEDIYEQNGYDTRAEYLDSLAEEYGMDINVVLNLAEILGPNEDFDGLVTTLQDLSQFRSKLYALARIAGDVQAATHKKPGTAITKRIGRRIAGKITGRLMGSIFPPTR